MQLCKAKGDVSRADVIELLHVTPPQAYRILQRLVKQNKLNLIGKGAGVKYIIT
jgi:ATP-dependent DNA helicase RecG